MTDRSAVIAARRVVVKVGSSSLAADPASLPAAIDALVDSLATLRGRGAAMVLVSSGAIAAGLAPLGLTRRPRDLATLQAAASVGQGLLVHRYAEAFARHGITAGQVLLTAEDVVRRAHHRNARRTFDRLLALGVVPVVNENDAVATEEIRFGDNDRLAALVAHLIGADLLVLLSDVDAVYTADPRRDPHARALSDLPDLAALEQVRADGSRSGVGTGGMATKLEAARLASSAGITCLIGSSASAAALLAGEPVGTLVRPSGGRLGRRLLWLAHASTPRGWLGLDDGAVAAVTERGSSLLAAGVVALGGDFRAGDPVELRDGTGVVRARGLVAYDAEEVADMLGRSSADLPAGRRRELVHRDDLVLTQRRPDYRGEHTSPSPGSPS